MRFEFLIKQIINTKSRVNFALSQAIESGCILVLFKDHIIFKGANIDVCSRPC